jgi:fumarate reductase flavoprotein subunit
MSAGKIPEGASLQSDVIVIGGGGGLAAAVAAAEKGAKVLVLEKRKTLGGNTAMARGLLAAESPVQKRLKIDARKEDLFKVAMSYSHWKINPRIIRALLDKSGDTVQWLEEMGVKFADVPHFITNQVPRIYHVVEGYGAQLVRILAKRCEQLGVEITYQTPATKILVDKKGRIAGVIASKKDKEMRINARSVIIATGGYSGNRDMLKKYFPAYVEDMHLYGVPNMGDGINMAMEIGAATEGLGVLLLVGPFFPGSLQVMVVGVESNTVWVNKRGERFADETSALPSETANALNRQPDKTSYTLFDETIKKSFMEEGLIKGVHRLYPSGTKMVDLDKYLRKEVEDGLVKISPSLNEIAQWIGADVRVLKETIDEYNSFCDRGRDDRFYKDRRALQPLRTPPYYALKCGQAFHGTIGGIKINHHMEVLNQQDSPIPGLYATGNDTGGWESDTYCYVLSGTALSFAINSGRIAGENAAKYIRVK